MRKLIDANELLMKLPNDLPYKSSVKRVLIQASTVEAEEVTHCIDCEHFKPRCEYDIYGTCAINGTGLWKQDDYCSRGSLKFRYCYTEDCPYQKGEPCEAWKNCGGFEDGE